MTGASPWPEDLKERVSELWAEGKSASEIGKIVGKSRDAILGQVWRMQHPVETRRKPVRKPVERIRGGFRQDVWTAWSLEPHDLRRAIWNKAKRGAQKTRLAAEEGESA